MNGSEILQRFAEAKAVVEKLYHQLGEPGDYLRGNGYDIEVNGFNVCTFGERDVKLSYIADNCCGRPWGICERIFINGRKTSVDDIDPDRDYDVPRNPSVAELLETGSIKPRAFLVYDLGSGQEKKVGEFESFERADAYARHCCQQEIDRLRKDRDWRPHAAREVRNDPLRAKEKEELRHYETYNYEGHRYWFAVKAAE